MCCGCFGYKQIFLPVIGEFSLDVIEGGCIVEAPEATVTYLGYKSQKKLRGMNIQKIVTSKEEGRSILQDVLSSQRLEVVSARTVTCKRQDGSTHLYSLTYVKLLFSYGAVRLNFTPIFRIER